MVVVRGVVHRSGLSAGTGGVDDLPQHPLIERQIRHLQAKALGLLHHGLLGRERQLLQIVNGVDRINRNTALRPGIAVIGMASCAEREHLAQPLILKSLDHRIGLLKAALKHARRRAHGCGLVAIRAILSLRNTSWACWL